MAVNYVLPSPAELQQIAQNKLPDLTFDDYFWENFPITEKDAPKLIWRQRDVLKGLQSVRGLGGDFSVVPNIGATEISFDPNYYGESSLIEEEEITTSADLASYDRSKALQSIIGERVEQLLQRRVNRIRKTMIDVLTTGELELVDRAGTVKGKQSYNIQEVNAAVSWSSLTTATPFADITALRLRSKGLSTSFGAGAKLLVNPQVKQWLLTNTNANDVFGRRTDYGATFNSLEQYNKYLKEFGDDVPEIVEYRKDYYTDAGVATYFLPDNYAILVGRRDDGAPIGEYRMTRNAQNPDAAPGAYTYVRDSLQFKSPRTFTVEDGHNGGPVIFFPSSVIALKVVL